MRKIAFFSFFLITILSFAQQDVGVVWMGFEHTWTYNHRLNRLGDYIEQPEYEGFDHPIKQIHTGATGVGWDEALFTSFYTTIKSKEVGFQAGNVTLRLQDKEGKEAIASSKITIPLQQNLQQKDQIVAVLNGFDLVANRRADKLKKISIEVSDPIYNQAKTTATFDVKIKFIANCGSLECNRFIQKVDYNIKVQYLLIAGNNDKFFGTEKPFRKNYEWDKKDPFEDGTVNFSVVGQPNFNKATMGFKSIIVNMDRDHWLVDWHTAIHPQFYNSNTGVYDFAMDLMLKQWKKKIDSPFKFQSKFSKRKDGWAYVNGSVVLLQFKDACVQRQSRFGTLSWKGMNKGADGNEAINVHRFKVKEGCE